MDDADSTLPPLTLSDIYGDEDLLQPPPHGSIISAASADKDEDDAASLVKETPPASSPDSGAASLGVGSATCSVGMEDGGTTADGIEGHDDFSVPVCIGDLIVSENQCKGQKPSVAADREDSLPELTRSMADLCTASPSAGGACCDGKCKPGQCKCPETCKGCPQADGQDQDELPLDQQIAAFEEQLASLEKSYPDGNLGKGVDDNARTSSSLPVIINAIHTTYAELHNAASPELVNKMRIALNEIPEVREENCALASCKNILKILNHKVRF